jgi:hypothetical protein
MENNYTNAEIADMHFMYGLADGNTREAHSLSRIVPQPEDSGKEYLQWDSSVSQRQWCICTELNRLREAAISKNS